MKILALGDRMFLLHLEMGGTDGRLVDRNTVVAVLSETLSDSNVGLVLLEASLVDALPEELYRRAFYNRQPEVVAMGGHWNEVLRRRVMQVLGADLLAPRR